MTSDGDLDTVFRAATKSMRSAIRYCHSIDEQLATAPRIAKEFGL